MASRCYDEMLSGGKSPEYYEAIAAKLDETMEIVRRLQEQSIAAQSSSSHSSDADGHAHADSAASRLRHIHERGDRSSYGSTSTSNPDDNAVHLEYDGFPALPSSTTSHNQKLTASYAQILQDSISAQRFPKADFDETEYTVAAGQDRDEWIVVDRSARSHRPAASKRRASRKNKETGDATLPMEKPSTDEKRTRKPLPQGWMDPNEAAQNARTSANSLKFNPVKCTLSKVTASKTPSYASPTAASKHRTTPPVEVERSPSPRKPKSGRLNTVTGKEEVLAGRHGDSHLVATPLVENKPRKGHSTQAKHHAMPPSFGLDGAFECRENGILSASSGNSVPVEAKEDTLVAKALHPDVTAALIRSTSPSRIPIAVAGLKSGSENGLKTDDAAAARPSESTTDHDSRDQRGGNAPLLGRIKRSLSNASTGSRHRGGTAVVVPPKSYSLDIAAQESAEAKVHDAAMIKEANKQPSPEQLVVDGASSSNNDPRSAPTVLLNVKKQTPEDIVDRQSKPPEGLKLQFAPSVTISDAEQRQKAEHDRLSSPSRRTPCVVSPEEDPAVLKCTRSKTGRTDRAQLTPKNETSDSSLRATAASFIPMHGLISSQRETWYAEVPQPVIVSSHPSSKQLSPPIGPMTVMAPGNCEASVAEEYNPQISTHRVSSFGHASGCSPPQMPYAHLGPEQETPSQAQSEQNSSPSLSNTLYSSTLGDQAYSPLIPRLEKIPEIGSQSDQEYWGWLASCQGGSGLPHDHGRVIDSPTTKSEEAYRHRRGWDVRSAAPGWWYGWRGGDGLEISFSGHGPVAEKNPNAPVNMNNYDLKSSNKEVPLTTHKPWQRGQQASPSHGGSPGQRIQRWTRRHGYPAVPCGRSEVIQAVEHTGVPGMQDTSNGWCHECWSR